MQRAQLGEISLQYEVEGSGEPVLLIHGAHIADAMRPLMVEPALEGYRRIRYRRRGFAGSTNPLPIAPASVAEQLADAVGVLDHVGVDRAHIAGHSGGALLAIELAARHPDRVTSLALLEPALLAAPSASDFMEPVRALAERYGAGDHEGAVEGFLALVGDRDWRGAIERTVPGGIRQAVQDAATFYEAELPAFAAWTFGAEQAAAISCPVLSVLGSDSGPLFAEGRELLHAWFPDCQDTDIPGASHLLQMEQPRAVAEALAGFFARVPSTAATP